MITNWELVCSWPYSKSSQRSPEMKNAALLQKPNPRDAETVWAVNGFTSIMFHKQFCWILEQAKQLKSKPISPTFRFLRWNNLFLIVLIPGIIFTAWDSATPASIHPQPKNIYYYLNELLQVFIAVFVNERLVRFYSGCLFSHLK